MAERYSGDFDQRINANIKALRRALGDSADNPRYIETLARRGYRLMPTVECLDPAAAGNALEKDREQGEHSSAEISHNAGSVQRQMKPHWWKAVVVLASVFILAGPYRVAALWGCNAAAISKNHGRRTTV
jgi:hypothetical protein